MVSSLIRTKGEAVYEYGAICTPPILDVFLAILSACATRACESMFGWQQSPVPCETRPAAVFQVSNRVYTVFR